MAANSKAQAVTLAYMKGLAKAVRQRAMKEALEAHMKPQQPPQQETQAPPPQQPKAG